MLGTGSQIPWGYMVLSMVTLESLSRERNQGNIAESAWRCSVAAWRNTREVVTDFELFKLIERFSFFIRLL